MRNCICRITLVAALLMMLMTAAQAVTVFKNAAELYDFLRNCGSETAGQKYELVPGKVYDLSETECKGSWGAKNELGFPCPSYNSMDLFEGSFDGKGAIIRGKFYIPLFKRISEGAEVGNFTIEITGDYTCSQEYFDYTGDLNGQYYGILCKDIEGHVHDIALNGGGHTVTFALNKYNGTCCSLFGQYLYSTGVIERCSVYNCFMYEATNRSVSAFVEQLEGTARDSFVAVGITCDDYSYCDYSGILAKAVQAVETKNIYCCSYDSDYEFSDFVRLTPETDEMAGVTFMKTGNAAVDIIQNTTLLAGLNSSAGGNGWRFDTEGWPVPVDSAVSFRTEAVGKDGTPLSIGSVKLGAYAFNIPVGTVIGPSDFMVVPEDGKTSLSVSGVMCNGSLLPDNGREITVGDYSNGMLFTCVVFNNDFEKVKGAAVNQRVNYNDAVNTKQYTAESLDAFDQAIKAAETADPLNTLRTECAKLMSNMTKAKHGLKLNSFTVTAAASGCTIDGENTKVYTGCKCGDRLIITATASAAGKNVFEWTDSVGTLLGTGDTLEYAVTRSTTLNVVCKNTGYSLTYKDSLGKIYKILEASSFDKITYPYEAGSTEMRVGYVLQKWTNDYGELPAEGEVNADITFTAKLIRDDNQSYKVAYDVQGVQGEAYLRIGKFFRYTAEPAWNDTPFACWIEEDTGQVISYDRELCIPVYSNMSIKAVYRTDIVIPEVMVNIQEPVCDKSNSKISFVCQVSAGESFDFGRIIGHGVVMLKSDAPISGLDLDTAGAVIKRSSGLSEEAKAFIINVPGPGIGENWYGRGYVIYKDEEGGIVTVYSSIKSGILE